WQDELYRRFHFRFDILTHEMIESAHTGNPFEERNLLICRLDQLSRNEDIQAKLDITDWDIIVCDEAHKMSASFSGGEVRATKRYRLGQLVGKRARHFLLLTATPHNGKEEDFQLFLALLDSDRFEGRFRDGVHSVDPSDLMRRMVKEKLLKFDNTPLFPERRAYTINYTLSDPEAQLYHDVTEYVREEMNRAERLEGDRGNVVGFALTLLQRRLASSPEAIYRSIERRRERLESRLREEQIHQRGSEARIDMAHDFTASMVDDDDDLPAEEMEEIEEDVVDRASAARTIVELQAEIRTLHRLEKLAKEVRLSNTDRKWEELSNLLQGRSDAESSSELFDSQQSRRKLIIFTEHRDTLNYLSDRIRTLIGRQEAVVTIHGGIGREDRRKTQEEFSQNPDVLILIATDAAGEGINLQRAHLMVNYDLPWNPNRVEQRFGRIHRIGQTEVCHLWNLVASETREGDVFHTLLRKLEQQRESLGGAVFDVLGKCFTDTSLRSLLIDAIRYGDQPAIRARLTQTLDNVLDREHLRELIEESALTHGIIDTTRLNRIREEMERAETRRLQPHYISSFFREAFKLLGGSVREREPKRYQVSRVPAAIRNRDRVIGVGEPVLTQYERIAFEKDLLAVQGKPLAAFVCPGHPLLDATLDLILERDRDLLKRGAVLVDPHGQSEAVRVMFYLEQKIQDGRVNPNGGRWIVSEQMQFVEIDENMTIRHPGYAPYLDYRPITEDERALVANVLEAEWLSGNLESQIVGYAVEQLIPEHLNEIKEQKEELVQKTLGAVKDRLTKEINYWDHRASQLRREEEAGRRNARMNAALAGQRADELTTRLERRTEELERERQISPLPPVVIGGALVAPQALLDRLSGETETSVETPERERIDRLAVAAVMRAERGLGREPIEMAHENPGYDIESKDPRNNRLQFIEVKGKAVGSTALTASKTQILTALNKPDAFILAIVEVDGDTASEPRYVRQPFEKEPDFGATSVNYDLRELLARSEPPN
ncbi:MAG: helicase-related protein, partial [Candidatus Poribacteria bacterium]|nr:helicase-related protein [Candidatus Poribacteria bacterium]